MMQLSCKPEKNDLDTENPSATSVMSWVVSWSQ